MQHIPKPLAKCGISVLFGNGVTMLLAAVTLLLLCCIHATVQAIQARTSFVCTGKFVANGAGGQGEASLSCKASVTSRYLVGCISSLLARN